jgi:hypothetical protein
MTPSRISRFGHPDFTPSCETPEEHPGCYEMVFILNDDGFGIEIFIPKTGGIDADLLAMCAEYATHRKTIRRYQRVSNSPGVATGSEAVRSQIPPPRPPAVPVTPAVFTTSACEPYRAWIEAQVGLGRNAVSIYQDLVEAHGFGLQSLFFKVRIASVILYQGPLVGEPRFSYRNALSLNGDRAFSCNTMCCRLIA